MEWSQHGLHERPLLIGRNRASLPGVIAMAPVKIARDEVADTVPSPRSHGLWIHESQGPWIHDVLRLATGIFPRAREKSNSGPLRAKAGERCTIGTSGNCNAWPGSATQCHAISSILQVRRSKSNSLAGGSWSTAAAGSVAIAEVEHDNLEYSDLRRSSDRWYHSALFQRQSSSPWIPSLHPRPSSACCVWLLFLEARAEHLDSSASRSIPNRADCPASSTPTSTPVRWVEWIMSVRLLITNGKGSKGKP